MHEDARLDALVRDEEEVARQRGRDEAQRVADEEMARALFGEEADADDLFEGGGAGGGEDVVGADAMRSGADANDRECARRVIHLSYADEQRDDANGTRSCCLGHTVDAKRLSRDSNGSGSGSGAGKREKWTEVYSGGCVDAGAGAGEKSLLD